MNAFSVPGAESTSAALHRVEQERDEAREALYTATWERDTARAELVSAQQELDALRTVRDRLDAALDHTRQQLGDAVNELMDWGVFGIPGASNPPQGAPPA